MSHADPEPGEYQGRRQTRTVKRTKHLEMIWTQLSRIVFWGRISSRHCG